jgi:hypothetical protein
MSSSTLSISASSSPDREVWESLKQAIAASSGFKQWQQESDNSAESTAVSADLEGQVRGYLRETLETLAY